MQRLALPRGPDREPVFIDGERHDLRGSDVRTLSIVGTFRVVPVDDLRDTSDRIGDLWHGDVAHLRREGLLQHVAPVGRDTGTNLVTLTERGRALLEAHREQPPDAPQTFHAGLSRVRELAHDSQLYRAYLRAAERLSRDGAQVQRVVLEEELKREYQQFLQAPNAGRRDADGRPARDVDEVRGWAEEHHLPCLDDRVQFPDVQIEYVTQDGRREVENVEVTTPHYRGRHAAAKRRAGFTRYRSRGGRAGGRTGRGSRFDPRLAEEFLQ